MSASGASDVLVAFQDHLSSLHHFFSETFPIGNFVTMFWMKVVLLIFGGCSMWYGGRFRLLQERREDFFTDQREDWDGATALVRHKTEDILGYGPTVCLGASIIGRGSWQPGRLASYAVVALSNPWERYYLVKLWVAIVAGMVMGVDNLPWETGALCCFCSAVVCAGPLQGLLLSFTPVARSRDFACALAVAILQGACTVKVGIDSDASSALLRGIIIWFLLLFTVATLRTEAGLSSKWIGPLDNTKRAELIKEFCEKVEQTGIQLKGSGFIVEDILTAYRRYGGTDAAVTRVLHNNLPNAVSRRQGVGGAREATDDDEGTAKKCAVRFFDAGANVGRLTIEENLGGDPELFRLLRRRFFVCPNIQRPTIELKLEPGECIPIIVAKADLEDTADGLKLDMRQIQVMQNYRQLRLRHVMQDNRESSGPIRGLWSITIEFYLLVTVSVLVAGWAEFGNENIEVPLIFSITCTFSAFMLLGPPPDYVAFWRLLERVTRRRGLIDHQWHSVARGSHAFARLAWLCLVVFFFGAAVTTSNVLESRDIVQEDDTTISRRVAEAVGAQALAEMVLELDPWTVAWGWLGSYWAIKALDSALSLSPAARFNGLATIVYRYDEQQRGTEHRGRIIEGCGAPCVAPGLHLW